MVHSAFFGVKKNNVRLLVRSSSIAAGFFFMFTFFAPFFVHNCFMNCFQEWFLLLYIAFAFFWAALHAWKLKTKLEGGAQLTRNIATPVGVTVGTIVGGQEMRAAPSANPFGTAAALQQDGVVMGRALTEAPAAPSAAEQKPPAGSPVESQTLGAPNRFDPETGLPNRFDPETGARLY